MEKKSIGSFLAALRKASGLTQEDVAQRLFVSNKTVSKWERDESSPDLALIPVLAEMFGVTCDEILRGERGEKEPGYDEKARTKTEKQVQRILTHTVGQFKSVSCVAAALTVLGLMCHFAVAYTYFKPLVAFGLGLAFLLGSVVLEIIQLIRTNAALQDGAMLGEGTISSAAIVSLLHRIAFAVFGLNAWAAIFIWPMVTAQGLDYANSVVSFDAYLSQLPKLLAICLAAAALAAYFARRWLGFEINKKSVFVTLRYKTGMTRRMARMQGAFLLGVAALFLLSPAIFLLAGGYSVAAAILILSILVIGLIAIIMAFIKALRHSKDRLERLVILLLSARNVLYGIAAFSVLKYVGASELPMDPLPRFRFPSDYTVSSAFFQMVLITMVYLIIRYFLTKNVKHENIDRSVT